MPVNFVVKQSKCPPYHPMIDIFRELLRSRIMSQMIDIFGLTLRSHIMHIRNNDRMWELGDTYYMSGWSLAYSANKVLSESNGIRIKLGVDNESLTL